MAGSKGPGVAARSHGRRIALTAGHAAASLTRLRPGPRRGGRAAPAWPLPVDRTWIGVGWFAPAIPACRRRFVHRPPVGTEDGAGIRPAVLDSRPDRPDRSCHAPGVWVMLAPHCCAAGNARPGPRRRLVARRHERSICANPRSGRNDRPIATGRPGGVALGRFPRRVGGSRREPASSTLKGEPSWRWQVIGTRRGSDVGS